MSEAEAAVKTSEGMVFRTQFNGYNKEDVNKYIADCNLRFEREEASYKKQIQALQAQIDESDEKIAALTRNEMDGTALSLRVLELEDKLKECTKNAIPVDEYEEKINELTAKLNEADIRVQAAAEQLEDEKKISGDALIRLEAANSELASVKSMLSAAEERAVCAETKVSAEAVDTVRATSAENTDDDRAAEYEAEIADLNEMVASLRAQLTEAEDKAFESAKSLEEANAAIAAMAEKEVSENAVSEIPAQTETEGCADMTSALNDRIRELEGELASVRENLSAAQADCMSAREDADNGAAAVEALAVENTSLKESIEALNTQIEALRQEAEDAKFSSVDRVIGELSSSDGSESDHEKAQLYDKVSRQLGSMLIDAREIADDVIVNANRKAEKIIEDAKYNAEEMRNAMRTESENITAEMMTVVRSSTKRAASDCMNEYLKYVKTVRDSFTAMIENNTAVQNSLSTIFDSITHTAEEEIGESLSKIIDEHKGNE